jgi:hypothetical protein
MEHSELLKRVKNMGYPLLEKEDVDVNYTLAEVIKTNDLRLWEGFALLLANSARKGLFDYEGTRRYLEKDSDNACFLGLIMMSFALYEALGVKFSWVDTLSKKLSFKKEDYEDMLNKVKQDENVKVGSQFLSVERMKNTFRNYFKEQEEELSNFASAKEEMGFEYALSQVFSPKQKELFLKRLKNEKMTKTEREYYSRAVKKKVEALANPELHKLALKVR